MCFKPLIRLAPQSGHISNFCGPTDPVIEPFKAQYFHIVGTNRGRVSTQGTQAGYVSN
jgi:hypothetical protein